MKKTLAAFVAVAAIAGSSSRPDARERPAWCCRRRCSRPDRRRDRRGRYRLQPPGLWSARSTWKAPPCRMARERFWDGYGWRYRHVEVCY